MIAMDDLLIPPLIFQWTFSVATMAAGVGAGVYLGQWLWVRWPAAKGSRRSR